MSELVGNDCITFMCFHKRSLVDKTASYFVGDAAGRPGDWASTDRKWAINVEIPFFTPEVSINHPVPLFSCL
jgi:hypothetical protein